MTAAALLQKLRQMGCVFLPEGDRLRVRAPAGVLTDELWSLIREHKAELLRLLTEAQGSRIPPRVHLTLSLRRDGRCYTCGGSEWWLSTYGVLVCRRCHPPAMPELVARWISREEAAKLAV